jgi:hypothetical protein
MTNEQYLMPRNFRFVGIFFFIAGLILGVARFHYMFKPDILDIKMFALYSEYIDSKYMEFVKNNLSEEITAFLIVAGLFMFAFSKEKNETEGLGKLRLKAFFIAAYSNLVFLLAALFFTFGFAFIYMLMINLIISLLAYIIAFRILLLKDRPFSANK